VDFPPHPGRRIGTHPVSIEARRILALCGIALGQIIYELVR